MLHSDVHGRRAAGQERGATTSAARKPSRYRPAVLPPIHGRSLAPGLRRDWIEVTYLEAGRDLAEGGEHRHVLGGRAHGPHSGPSWSPWSPSCSGRDTAST